jgi:hypothetical protein
MWWIGGTKDKSPLQSISMQENDEKNTAHKLSQHYRWLKYLIILNPKPKEPKSLHQIQQWYFLSLHYEKIVFVTTCPMQLKNVQ